MILALPGFAIVLRLDRLDLAQPVDVLQAIAAGWQVEQDLAILQIDDPHLLKLILAELAAVGLQPERMWPDGPQGAVIVHGRMQSPCPGLSVQRMGDKVVLTQAEAA